MFAFNQPRKEVFDRGYVYAMSQLKSGRNAEELAELASRHDFTSFDLGMEAAVRQWSNPKEKHNEI